jgi:hypothetical protein
VCTQVSRACLGKNLACFEPVLVQRLLVPSLSWQREHNGVAVQWTHTAAPSSQTGVVRNRTKRSACLRWRHSSRSGGWRACIKTSCPQLAGARTRQSWSPPPGTRTNDTDARPSLSWLELLQTVIENLNLCLVSMLCWQGQDDLHRGSPEVRNGASLQGPHRGARKQDSVYTRDVFFLFWKRTPFKGLDALYHSTLCRV